MSLINIRQISGIPDDIEAQITALKKEIKTLKAENKTLKSQVLASLTAEQIDSISKNCFTTTA